METALVWMLRAVGLLWIAGGAAIIHQSWQLYRIGQMTDELEDMADAMQADLPEDERSQFDEAEQEPDDRMRDVWVGTGGVVTFLTGCALVAASWISMPLSIALCLHQTAYMARQVRRQKAAASERHKAAEAVAPTTRNATLFAFAVSACVIYLTLSGAYG